MTNLRTSASVGYADVSGGEKRLIIETDSSPGLVPGPGQTFIKVYPSSASPKVTAVMGGVARVATKITEPVSDYVSFGGASSASLRYVPDGPVKIEDAKFFEGKPKVVYEAESNSLILSQNAFGICRVTYTASFDRFVVSHGDSPCAKARQQTRGALGGDGGDAPRPGEQTELYYDPAFLVATATGWVTGSLEVGGPPCSQSNQGVAATAEFNKYEAVGIKIEEDVEFSSNLYPFYFKAGGGGPGFTLVPQVIYLGGQAVYLYAGCRIRVYPDQPVTLVGVNCAVGSSQVGKGSKPVIEALTFSGSQSQGLSYPPSGRVSVAGAANAVTSFGTTTSVSFKTGGEWVNEVEWVDATTYRVAQGSRLVKADEIVCTTSLGNNTIPCFTFAQVQYSADYALYDVLFNWDDAIQWYAPAMVLATDGNGVTGSIELQPPGKGGVL